MSHTPFSDLAHLASDWIWESDGDHCMTFLSERAHELSGLASENGLGHRRDALAANRDDAAFWGAHREDLATRKPFKDFVYPRLAEDGEIRWLRVSGVPRYSGDGLFLGYRGVGSDVTDERRKADALAQALREAGRTRRELEEQNRRFDATLANMAEGVVVLDASFRVTVCNQRYLEVMDLPPDVAHPGAHLRDIVSYAVAKGRHPGRTADDLYADRMALFARGAAAVLRTTVGDGRVVETTYRPMVGGEWVATYRDISDRLAAEEAVQEQNRRFDAALSNMSQGLCMFDENMQVVILNQRYRDIFGLDPAIVRPGVSMRQIMEHSVALGNHPGMSGDDLYRTYRRQLAAEDIACIHRELSNGRTIAISHGKMPGGGWVATYEDVTQRRQAEAQIAHMARHDALTGLPNRLLFRERLEEALERTSLTDRAFAIHCLDLDHFKTVNDTLGHPVGDQLLQAVTRRIQEVVPGDATLARLGGDEFALIQAIAHPLEASDLARVVIATVGAPYDLDGHNVVVGTSVGVALAPTDARDPDTLLKQADLALYRAKTDGRGVYRFFEAGMDAQILERRALELDLRAALVRNEFELWYQPQVDASSGAMMGFEALLRWHHPDRGLVYPASFVPLAEDIGLIVPLGEWVIREACREAMRWPANIRVAVNISPAQFKSRTLELAVVSALGQSGLDPRRLELEITETVLFADTDATLGTLHNLRALGVRISMDDFGTGYSSLSYLRAFPFDKIKIDRSFVQELGERADCSAIVEAIASLGTKLGMTTTAEGVETVAQLDSVRAMGCSEIQGYLVSRPVPAHALGQWLDPGGPAARAA